ncbi:MAG: radical SAM protein [Tissierellia bacterium]|nr:radical SAM protein [Tissierellia bacterium]
MQIIYRPPSEAKSVIIQLTKGCRYNTCTFCGMYKDVKFHIRKISEVKKEIDYLSAKYRKYNIDRIFFADGDALCLKTDYLKEIFEYANEKFKSLNRIGIYATAKDVLNKSEEELKELLNLGLKIVYIGLESGDQKVLDAINKKMTVNECIDAVKKLKKIGILTSVTLIAGLGSSELSYDHALNSAKAITKMKPDYLGFLTLEVEKNTPLYKNISSGDFKLLNADQIMDEFRIFLENVDSQGTVFRANHASNYINLKGTLNFDNKKMIKQIDDAKKSKDYMPEEFRRL